MGDASRKHIKVNLYFFPKVEIGKSKKINGRKIVNLPKFGRGEMARKSLYKFQNCIMMKKSMVSHGKGGVFPSILNRQWGE